MNKKWTRRTACLAIAFAALVGVAVQTSAGPVPFKGRAAAIIAAQVPVGDAFDLIVSATGEATHLGRFTRTENLTLVPLTGTVEGTLVFTAANGDQLFADVSGGFVSGTRAEGTYTFTGGTGRFSDSTGTAEFVAEATGLGQFDIAFEGTISF